MKKNIVIVRGLIIAMGLALCQSVAADDLQAKINETFKNEVELYYNNQGKVQLSSFDRYFDEATQQEQKAFDTLLPKFFEIVRTEAIKRPWFWKGDYKKSDWWKALNEKDGKANKFMAYLYNINGVNADKQWTDKGMTITPDKTMLFYSLNDDIFYKEPISFFKRHWGKLALASVLAGAAAGYAGYEYRHVWHPAVEGVWSSLSEGASNLYSDVTDLPSRAKHGYQRWRRESGERKQFDGKTKTEYDIDSKLKAQELQLRVNKSR